MDAVMIGAQQFDISHTVNDKIGVFKIFICPFCDFYGIREHEQGVIQVLDLGSCFFRVFVDQNDLVHDSLGRQSKSSMGADMADADDGGFSSFHSCIHPFLIF